RALDVLSLAEAMLLAGEQQITDRYAVVAQRLDHLLGLARWHDPILVALEEDDGSLELLGMLDWRAFAIARRFLRIRPDQPIEIARLELVGIASKGRRIAYPIVAGAALKEVAGGQRRERRIAARAAARDDGAPGIDASLRGEEAGAVDAVVDVDK